MTDEMLHAEELPDSLAQFADEPPPSDQAVSEEASEHKSEPQVDPIAEKATKGGWRSKEDWVASGRDPDEWVDAGEFVRRQPLFEKINKLNKALKEKDQRIEQVSKYAAQAAENARLRTIQELEAKRLEAVQVGDTEAFQAADKQLKEIEAQPAPLAQPEPQSEPEIPEPIKNFAKRNELWFEKDKAMTIFMVETTKEYRAQGLELEAAMDKAEADVKREFAHKFANPNKEKPAPVASSSGERRPAKATYADLSADQRAVWASLKNHMTFDEFAKGLKEQGDLK